MKAGFIDILLGSMCWVLGRAALFALAILAGIGLGGFALWAATSAAGGGFGFPQGSHPVHHYLIWIAALIPQLLLLFWAGILFVRSEGMEMKHWGRVAALQALLMVFCFSRALPDGWLAQTVAWGIVLGGAALQTLILRALERRRTRRGMDYLAALTERNAARRAELKEKYGTTSASARELGIE